MIIDTNKMVNKEDKFHSVSSFSLTPDDDTTIASVAAARQSGDAVRESGDASRQNNKNNFSDVEKKALKFTIGVTSETEGELSCASLNQTTQVRRKIKRKSNKMIVDSGSEASSASQASVISMDTNKSTEVVMDKRSKDMTQDKPEVALFEMKSKKRRLAIRDEGNPTFTHPGAARPVKTSSSLPTIELKNRHEGKTSIPKDMEVVVPQTTSTPDEEVAAKAPAVKRPPPIVIHGHLANHKKVNTFLANRLRDKYHWKHSNNTTTIQVYNRSDWDAVHRYFDEGKVEYHSYTPKDEKTHAFVLRGLYHEIETDEIKEQLEQEHKIVVKDVYTLKGTRHPTFMVVTNNTITLKEMQARVRYLDHTSVTWERHINNKIIIQCHRCQQWGHATTNCRAAPTCLKCAEGHFTKECQKSMNEPAKCANCGGPHPANNTQCVIYKRRIEGVERQATRIPPPAAMKYVAAPIPRTNIWEERVKTQTQPEPRKIPGPRQQSYSQPEPRSPLMKTPPPELQRTQQSDVSKMSDMEKLERLQTEARRTASLVNLDLLLARMIEMNDMLEKCPTAGEKLKAVTYFLGSIPDDAF